VTKHLFFKEKTPEEIHGDKSHQAKSSPFYSTVKNRVARFKTEHFSTEDNLKPLTG
jgi:hypothetical protein